MQFADIPGWGPRGVRPATVIVSPRDGRFLMVRQVDHQAQCGLMAEAWGNATFARPEPWGPVVTAAAWHDEGWRPLDDATEPGADGAPLDFPHLDDARHVAMYADGIRAACDRGPRAGLLVSMHGQGLHESRLGLDGPLPPRERLEPPVRAFLEDQDALQARLLAGIGDPDVEAWAWDAYRLLQAMDRLSLYLLWSGLPKGASWALARVPRAPGDDGVDITLRAVDATTCAMSPYPFAEDRLALPVAARFVPRRPYADAADLQGALADAPWTTEAVRVVAG